jgi:acyl-CoA thioesterase
MNALKNFLAAGDRFAAHSGIELLTVEPGHAITRLTVQPWHLNAVGLVQGGAIFTLADFAFAAASNSRGTVAVGINASITYQNPARVGELTAEAKEVGCNPKLASYTVTVKGTADQVIAIFQGLVYRKDAPMPPPSH